MDNLQDKFIERTKNHITLVNKYAKKLGKSFPLHDNDKLHELAPYYQYFSKENRSKMEEQLLDQATLKHITCNKHHPEYWTTTSLKGFTRKNPNPNGPIDATRMSREALEEMVCDWCACSEEFGNTPFEWFNKVKNTRWVFNNEQELFICSCITICWN